MKNTFFVKATVAGLLLSAGTAMADTVPLDGRSGRGNSVPTSMSQVFGTLGDTSPGGGEGSRPPGSELTDGPGIGIDPVGSSGVAPTDPTSPTLVPLPPALISGLVGLAAVGVITRLRRRSLSH